MRRVIIYKKRGMDQISELALTSNVHIECDGPQARVRKDRSFGFNFHIADLSKLETVLKAIYPDYEIEDCRA